MRIAILLLLSGTVAAAAAEPQRYVGICEPSGGAFIDATHFAVASDESNVLRIYKRGSPDIVDSPNLTKFLDYDKSDIEGAAVGDGVIYWTASQSENSNHRDGKRKVVFKTAIKAGERSPTLEPVGVVREDLKADIVRLSGATAQTINVEGLAATPSGGLLFGLRNLVDGKAVVVHLENADAVLAAQDNRPQFGETARLDLQGRGVRSLERVGERYLIVAGKPEDQGFVGYALYWWDGTPQHAAEPWSRQPDFAGLDPEVAMPLPGGKIIQIISDDGDRCPKVKLEDPPVSTRGFLSIDVPF
ncbi:DUF3616 domain-containing protein [Xanthobacter sp. V4C-4]|uniref:DUF3616 domain-containing protein n=1 Tax=Xanthobacter cornucopiae TaxID=3119924 RepID=UPI003729733F